MASLAVLIVNFRTEEATLQCLHSLLPELSDAVALVLDNDSGVANIKKISDFADQHAAKIHFLRNTSNTGFAGGMNILLHSALANASCRHVLLLNSDIRCAPGFISAMRSNLDPEHKIDMVAATMLNERDASVDSLGITIFRSTLASNRKRVDEILVGPSGGCALLTRRLLEDLLRSHGEIFDDSFFCYAEDTDLAVRARSLGYQAAHAADAVVHHVGSLSSGGRSSDFVLYHGIRNSIWWLVKNAPLGWFLRSLPWFIVLHMAIWIRHVRRGKFRVLWRLYREAIKGIPAMRKKRAVIMKSRRVPASEFSCWVEPHFYERGYLRRAWRELFKPAPKD